MLFVHMRRAPSPLLFSQLFTFCSFSHTLSIYQLIKKAVYCFLCNLSLFSLPCSLTLLFLPLLNKKHAATSSTYSLYEGVSLLPLFLFHSFPYFLYFFTFFFCFFYASKSTLAFSFLPPPLRPHLSEPFCGRFNLKPFRHCIFFPFCIHERTFSLSVSRFFSPHLL
jgi:hypothetical protein